jgi:gamma-glutamyltranspeptidase/glutathione hydrolase
MRIVLGAVLAILAAAPLPASAKPPTRAPVAAAAGPRAMVAAANPAAVEAGLKVLRAGGSAVDAAVAVQAALGLVEPQSSGLGGGAFMTFYDAKTHAVTAYDGREIAPAGAGPDMFLGADGKPMPKGQAMVSGRSAGVPGAIAMLYLAQKEHGRRPWSTLFGEAERLATEGFLVGPRLAGMAASGAPQAHQPDVVAYFTKADGTLIKAGDHLKNPAYADTLRRIAAHGPDAILKGPTAAKIVARLAAEPMPGTMTVADLAAYQPHEDKGLCRPYRVWIVCVPNLPSGGSATLQALGLLERTDIATRGPADPQAWLQMAQAERLMYADRDRYVGDPAFVKVPLEGLLAGGYLDQRAHLIAGDTLGPAPSWGQPAGAVAVGADATHEPGGTTSFVVADAAGNVVSMTTTVESVFGDGRMVDGFLLNNQLTDFSFAPHDADGLPAANAVGPRKRPRSSMSPTIILDRQGRFVAAVGSPGGPAIPSYVLKAVVGVLDWKLSMQEAINLPNMIAFGNYIFSEPNRYPPGVVDALKAKGITMLPGLGEASGLHGVMVRDGHLEGGADPRREGEARGY